MAHGGHPYKKLLLMLVLTFISMYILMYAMLNILERLNAVLISLSSIGLIAFFLLIQFQTAVSDKQFLKGMIHHHAAAILMSEQSKSQDPEIKKLQEEIITSPREKIKVMKAKLQELEK